MLVPTQVCSLKVLQHHLPQLERHKSSQYVIVQRVATIQLALHIIRLIAVGLRQQSIQPKRMWLSKHGNSLTDVSQLKYYMMLQMHLELHLEKLSMVYHQI
jgi:hypothetical protein